MENISESRISCIIPTYNRCPYQQKIELNPLWWSVTSLSKQRNLEEIIIVDDNSEDYTEKTVEELRKKNEINIVYYKNNIWQGSGKSRNQGVELAKNDLLFFMDDDCIMLNNNILYRLQYAFIMLKQEKERIGAMTLPVTADYLEAEIAPMAEIGKVDAKNGRLGNGTHRKFPREYLKSLDDIFLDKELKIVRPIKVDVIGGVFLSEKKAVKEAGGFPTFPWRNAYAEEPELVLNMQKHKWGVYYLPSLEKDFRVFHCKYGFPFSNRDTIPFSINGVKFERILKESSKGRLNTGNRVDNEELLYSKIISDIWILLAHFGEEAGLRCIELKHKEIFDNNNPYGAMYKDLSKIRLDKKIKIFKKAVKDGVKLLREKGINTTRVEEIFFQKYLD